MVNGGGYVVAVASGFRFITGVNMCQRIVVTVYMIRIISDYANTHGCTI